MANNPDFLKLMIRDVDFFWPRLDQPYRYNAQTKRTEAASAGAPNAGYSIAWDMPTAKAKELHGELRKHYEACRSRNSKLPEFAQVFGMKKDPEAGTVRFTAKKRAMSADGKINKPPRVLGADLTDLDEKAIWSGSKGDLRVLAFAATDPDGGGGISLLLDVVQVKEAVYGGDGIEDDFAPAKTSSRDLSSFDEDAPAGRARAPADAEF
jgi:hypothetical protein